LWQSGNAYFHQLARLIALAGVADEAELVNFLDAAVTPNALRKNYAEARLGGLAGTFFTLAAHLPVRFHEIFNNPAFFERLTQVSAMQGKGPSDWADLLSLIGSASVLLGQFSIAGVNLETQNVSNVMASRPARNPHGGLSYAAAQFWCGLHVLALERREFIAVPAVAGEEMLDTWCEAEPPTGFMVALNSVMVAWLQDCRENEWILARPEFPIRQAVLTRVQAASSSGDCN
jgi:hypothetical protein